MRAGPVPASRQALSVAPSTLDYVKPRFAANDPSCDPGPGILTRVRHVISFTTVGDNAAGDSDRNAPGSYRAGINADNLKSRSLFAGHCPCWFEGISTLTATFTSRSPDEFVGLSVTLTLQYDGTYTGSGTYGTGSRPFDLVYDPCVNLRLTLSDCVRLDNPITEVFDMGGGGGTWQPIDLTMGTEKCYNDPFDPFPECGVTENIFCEVGSPLFDESNPGLRFELEVTE